MPTSNVPATVYRRIFGTIPTAVSAPFGEITVTVSPGRTPSARASSRPSRIAGSPFSRGWRLPVRSCKRMSWRTAGVRRSMPRTRPPWEPPPDVVNSACWWMNGVAERTPGTGDSRHDRARVGEPRAGRLVDEQVGVGRDDLLADPVLEARHYREHDDQGCHAEEDPSDADPHEE